MTSPGASAPTSAPPASTTGSAPLPPELTTRERASSRGSSPRSTLSSGRTMLAITLSSSAKSRSDAPTWPTYLPAPSRTQTRPTSATRSSPLTRRAARIVATHSLTVDAASTTTSDGRATFSSMCSMTVCWSFIVVVASVHRWNNRARPPKRRHPPRTTRHAAQVARMRWRNIIA